MPPTLFGRYLIEGELGRGAMGTVYRGLDPALDRPVAVKVISTDRAGQGLDELEARFLREAKVSARLSHPGIVTVFDAGRQGEALYLVMELIEGESLADRMSRGVYPEAWEALELCAQVADALAAAHAIGIIHRDIKPANVLLTRDRRVKVTDFGVAKAIGEDTGLTRTGTVVGSPAYMAPEQIRGESIDPRADLFSLGVVLYELLLRRKPFPADTLTTLIFQILNEDPFADPNLSRTLGAEISAFLRQALAKDRDARVPNAAAFATAARRLAGSLRPVDATAATSVISRQPGPLAAPVAAPPPAAGRRSAPGLGIALGVLAVGACALAAALLLARRAPAPPAGEALHASATTPTAEQAPPEIAAPEATPAPTARPTATPAPTASPSPTTSPQPIAPPLEPVVIPASLPLPTPLPPRPTPTPVVAEVFTCSVGAEFNVSPEEATVEINGRVIGIADDWDGAGGGEQFTFQAPGDYFVKLTHPGHRTVWVKIEVRPDAKRKIADVDTELEEDD